MSDTETNKPRRKARKTSAFADDWPVAVPEASAGSAAPERQRVARAMARAGLCSRRDAEAWILEGRVTVNGEVLKSPARDVGPDDSVEVDGAPLPQAEKTRLFLFHKPRGLVTSDHDPEGRETVTDYLRANWPQGPRVVTIGRLDINTEGLLLLTNDGGLARQLELPKTGWLRRYRVRANGETDQAQLDALAAGITIEDVDYAGIEAKLDRVQGANCWLTMGLREGKNREIKRVLEHLGLEVNRLIRLSFGPFQLLDLEEGAVEEVRTRVLKDQLGAALAAEAGVDFGDAPVPEAPAPAKTGRDKAKSGKTQSEKALATSATIAQTPRQRREAPARAPERDGERSLRRKPTAFTPKTETRDEREPGRPRRHVSSLRSARAEDVASGPRKRIERSATQDRNERVVTVERKVSTRPARSLSPSAEGKRARIARSGGTRSSDERDTKREGFRSRDAAPRGRPSGDRGRNERSNGEDTRRERPARTGREDRPQRSFGAGKPRGRDGGRSETPGFDATRRPSFGKPRGRGGDAAEGGAAKPSRAYSGKPRGGAARGEEAAGLNTARPNRPYAGKAREAAGRGDEAVRSGEARPKRPYAGKPREGRPANGAGRGSETRSGGASRSSGGRTFGKDDARGSTRNGDRPSGGKTGGSRDGGSRPGGSRPSGGKPGGSRPRGGSGGAPSRGKR